tara:strand:- start:509 stop:1099 length:591 start_codon:yes stop_codon:yes gene_type:complete
MTFFGNQKDLKAKPKDVWRHSGTDLFGKQYVLKNERQEWQTPPQVFNFINKKYKLNHDACASETNHLCKNYWTANDNALLQDWGGKRIWCNPPWGSSQKDIEVWSSKAYRESLKPNTLICFLFPINTSANWFVNNICYADKVYNWIGNLKWKRYDSKGQLLKSCLPFSTAVAVFKGSNKSNKEIMLESVFYDTTLD